MREKKTYSRFIQNVYQWRHFEKGRMIQMLHHCIEHDITTYDTANFSGTGQVNQTFGTALSESGLSRDEIQLVGRHHRSTNPNLVEWIEELLLNLKTDYVDLLLLDFEELTPERKTNLDQLLFQGKILEIGAFNFSKDELDSFEIPLKANLTKSPLTSSEVMKDLHFMEKPSEEITHLIWFENNKNYPQGRNRLIMEWCEKYNLDRDQLLLAWVLKHPAHLHPILLYSDYDQIDLAVHSKEVRLDPMDWEKIKLLLT